MRFRIKGPHAQRIVVPQHFRRRNRRAFGHLELLPGHGAGTVEHDGDCGALFFFFIGCLEPHRQHFLNRCAIITTDTERSWPAEHHEAAAEFIDVVTQRVHERIAELMRGHVGENHAVVTAELVKGDGEIARLAQIELDALFFHRLNQVARLAGIGLDVKQPQTSAHIHDGKGAIVSRQRVAAHAFKHGSILKRVTRRGRAREGDLLRRARFERHRSFLHLNAVLVELQRAAAFDGAFKHGLQAQTRAFKQTCAVRRERDQTRIRSARAGNRQRVQLDARNRRLAGCGEQAAASLVPVANNENVAAHSRMKHRFRILDGSRVMAVAAVFLLPVGLHGWSAAFGQKFRLRAELHDERINPATERRAHTRRFSEGFRQTFRAHALTGIHDDS